MKGTPRGMTFKTSRGTGSEKPPCLLCAGEERGPMQPGSKGEGRGDKLRRISVQVGPDGHGQEC